jgi:hypothetical protein
VKVPTRPAVSIARFFASRLRVRSTAPIITGRRREIKTGRGEIQEVELEVVSVATFQFSGLLVIRQERRIRNMGDKRLGDYASNQEL